jgi:addiction module HigA family antidote
MIPKRNPIHPGEILREEFLDPMEIPQTKLAQQLGIPLQRVNEICTGKRGITAETAWLLSAAFNNTPQFWMNLQTMYDLARAREHIDRLPKPLRSATR